MFDAKKVPRLCHTFSGILIATVKEYFYKVFHTVGVAACGWRHERAHHYGHCMQHSFNAIENDGARVETFGEYSVLKETSMQVRNDEKVSNFAF